MQARRLMMLGVAMLVVGCNKLEPNVPGGDDRATKQAEANAKRLKQACGSSLTYDRLKSIAFEQAQDIRKSNSALLDRLAAGSVVRMERPVATSRDEDLNVTVCTGHFVLELPPGAADAFDGDQRLEADVEYAAQEAADGSGLVYQIKGAEPIVYRLAAMDLQAGSRPDAVPAPPTRVADAATLPVVPAQPTVPAPPAAPAPAAPRPAPPPVPIPPPPAPVVEAEPARVAARPSFWCSTRLSRVERMICSDGDLAARDRAMSSAYFAAIASAPDARSALRSSRDRFLRVRDRCGDAGCVARAYADRVAEIRDIAGGG